MGKRGPKPTPTAIKKRRGTYRKDRAAPNEPTPEVKVPGCPSILDPEAKREWRRVTKLLAKYGVVSELDRSALAVYCSLWARYWEWEKVARGPDATEAKKALSHVEKLGSLLKQYLAMFGLTPADRSRVSGKPPKESDGHGHEEPHKIALVR